MMYKVVSMGQEMVSVVGTESINSKVLLDLPPELVKKILNFCSLSDIARFARVSSLCNQLSHGAILSETIPSLLSSLPQDLPARWRMFRRLQTSRFLTLKSQQCVTLTYDLESLDYLKLQLPTILHCYNLQLDKIYGLTKDVLINSSVDLALSLADEHRRSCCLSDIAQVVLKVGDVDRALEIAKSIPNESEKLFCLRDIAKDVFEAGDVERAAEIAKRILNEGDKTKFLSDIVKLVLKTKDFERAVEISKSIPDEYRRSCCLRDIAKVVVEAGDDERAVEIAESMSLKEEKTIYLVEIVIMLLHRTNVEIGDIKRATEIAKSISNENQKAYLLRIIDERFAKMGDIDKEPEIKFRIPNKH